MNKNKKRIFTFGCSFTQYKWPTWADIILYENCGLNVGMSGAGFDFILYRLMEVDRKFKLTPDDEIIIVYPSPIRLDLIIGDPLVWKSYNQVFSTGITKKNDLYNIEGLLYKSYNNILLIHNYLSSKNLKFHYGSMINIFDNVSNSFEQMYLSSNIIDLIKYVKDVVEFDLIDFYTYLNKDKKEIVWIKTKNFEKYTDYHPTTKDHFSWVKNILLPKIDIELKITEEQIQKIDDLVYPICTIDEMNNFVEKYPEFFQNRANNSVYLTDEYTIIKKNII